MGVMVVVVVGGGGVCVCLWGRGGVFSDRVSCVI